tara:strand:+ start:42 stop:521 length:480 start_codon:yes stop_codon:yes gene_type:complete
MKRKSIKTSKKQIIEWGKKNIDECGYGVDMNEMNTRCWRCGYERETERCHVIPHSLGGEDTPSNFRLLCNECHHEAPNVNDPEEMDNWIRRTNVGEYDTFWEIREIFDDVYKETSIHFGHMGMNISTKSWFEKKLKKRLEEKGFLDRLGIEKYTNCLKS